MFGAKFGYTMPNSKHVLKRYKQGRRQSFHLAPHESNAQRSAKARMHPKFHEFTGLHMSMQQNEGGWRSSSLRIQSA